VPDSAPTVRLNDTGMPLTQLVSQLQDGDHSAVVLRADPEYTDAAQLATVGLYGTNPGQVSVPVDARSLEQQAALLSPAPRTSYELMCALARADSQLENDAAVLVPEQVMAQFNDPTGPHPPGCDTGTLGTRHPQYPADVGELNLPFVHVTWRGGDRDTAARTLAVRQLHSWLVGPAGQQVFTAAGYRGVAGGTAAVPPAGSWLTTAGRALPDPTPVGYDVSTAAVNGALDEYRAARGPGRVLFLLDASSSMSSPDHQVWSGPGQAKDLISQSLDGLGGEDTYGVWAVVGRHPATSDLVPLARYPDPAVPRAALAAADPGDDQAAPADALTRALSKLTSQPANKQPQLIVYVTDEEDDNYLAGKALKGVLDAVGADGIPVDWVSLASGGCTTGNGKPGPVLAAKSSGRCLEASSGLASALRAEVARVGTGDAR
jgi:hypothetical protein